MTHLMEQRRIKPRATNSRLSGSTFANEVVFATVPSSSPCNHYPPVLSDKAVSLNDESFVSDSSLPSCHSTNQISRNECSSQVRFCYVCPSCSVATNQSQFRLNLQLSTPKTLEPHLCLRANQLMQRDLGKRRRGRSKRWRLRYPSTVQPYSRK